MICAPGFFDFDDRLKRLSDLGDQLEAFQKAVYFEMFRADLVTALGYTSEPRELAKGQKSTDRPGAAALEASSVPCNDTQTRPSGGS